MKVNKIIMLRKGLLRGAQYAAVVITALNTVPLPADVGVGTQATLAFVIGAIGAVGKAVHNFHKTKNRQPSFPGYLFILVPALCLGALAGCITTTDANGTRTVRIDGELLETAWERYESLEARRIALEAEERTADAARRAQIAAELRRLGPEIRAAAQDLGIIPREPYALSGEVIPTE